MIPDADYLRSSLAGFTAPVHDHLSLDTSTSLRSWPSTVPLCAMGLNLLAVVGFSDTPAIQQGSIQTHLSTPFVGQLWPWGVWSDGEPLWVADGIGRKLYAYAVPGLRRAVVGSALSSRAAPVPSGDPGALVSIPHAGLRSRIAVALGKAPEEAIGTNELAALWPNCRRLSGCTSGATEFRTSRRLSAMRSYRSSGRKVDDSTTRLPGPSRSGRPGSAWASARRVRGWEASGSALAHRAEPERRFG